MQSRYQTQADLSFTIYKEMQSTRGTTQKRNNHHKELYYSSQDDNETVHSAGAGESEASYQPSCTPSSKVESQNTVFGEAHSSRMTGLVKYEDESWKEEEYAEEEDDYADEHEASFIDADQPIENIPVKRRKDRKIRTTVTKERLQKMNSIFAEYYERRESGKEQTINLKEIANELNLGYSTILHKFRQFRAHRQVKGGALLESLQKKRKYKKSYEIENYIDMSLKERSFATSVELSHFIYEKYGKNFSRSIISRHLATMGYSFNNVKYHSPVINDPEHLKIRYMYAVFLQHLSQVERNYIYIDEFAYPRKLFVRHAGNFAWSVEDRMSETEADYVSVLMAANNQKVYYYDVVPGFAKKEHFCAVLKHLRRYLDYQDGFGRTKTNPVLLTDTHRIHIDTPQSMGKGKASRSPDKSSSKEFNISDLLEQLKLNRYYLPPGSPQLNPLETIFDTLISRLPKQETMSQKELKNKLETVMKDVFKEPTTVFFKSIEEWHCKALKREPFDER